MLKRRTSYWAITAVLVTFALIVGALLQGTIGPDFTFCGPAERNCVREWIGALSGWAAGAAALITACVVYRQFSEMRRQTDYLIGDAPPTMSARHHDNIEIGDIELRIANWGRSAFDLREVRISGTPFRSSISVMQVVVDSNQFDHMETGVIDPPVPVAGWENRSEPPPICRIDVFLHADDGIDNVPDQLLVEFETILVLHNGRRELELTAELTVNRDDFG